MKKTGSRILLVILLILAVAGFLYLMNYLFDHTEVVPGIFSGIILAIGRIVGETAALIFTAGTFSGVAGGVMESGRTLAVHMYCLLNEGLHRSEAYATAVVLLVMVIGINALSGAAAKRIARRTQ